MVIDSQPIIIHKSIRTLLIDDEEIEYRFLKKTVQNLDSYDIQLDYAPSLDEAITKRDIKSYDVILMDNRLMPDIDFRVSVPILRERGYIGPIGVISSDISGAYFQQFSDYGADFRVGKSEIDVPMLNYIFKEFIERNFFPGDEEIFGY
jgi:CheY-like chemotaxis protein